MISIKFINQRLDMVVKYLYIKSYIEQENYLFYKDLYLKHIKERTGFIEDWKSSAEDYITAFNTLIDSIQRGGFDSKYPIEYNDDGMLVGGAHRLSCCLYFSIEGKIIVVNKTFKLWGEDWFLENNFSLLEVQLILKEMNRLIGNS